MERTADGTCNGAAPAWAGKRRTREVDRVDTSLWQLVWDASEFASDDGEVVEIVMALLRSRALLHERLRFEMVRRAGRRAGEVLLVQHRRTGRRSMPSTRVPGRAGRRRSTIRRAGDD